MLACFRFNHLQPELQVYSVPFFNLAYWVAANLPRCAERTVVLRKLLEAKDAAVRCAAIPELSGLTQPDAPTKTGENSVKIP